MRLLIGFIAFATTAASAATLTGQIDEPALRRKTTLVYLETAPGKFAAPASPAVMNQIRNTYAPRVLPVLVGQKIEFRSEDPELHNVYARQAKTTLFNQAVLPHKMFERTMEKPGVVHLSCNVHKEMSADILVLQNPYFAHPDASGRFTIAAVPAGKYTLRIFGEQLSDEQRARTFTVTVGSSPAPLKLAMQQAAWEKP
jgi:plastocyanin